MGNNDIDVAWKAYKKYLAVMAGDGQYGIDIGSIEGVLRVEKIVRVPGSQPYFAGVCHHHGTVVPVLSLRRKLGFGEDVLTEASRIVALKMEQKALLGILVDRVGEVVDLCEQEIDSSADEEAFINGVGKVGDGTISLLQPGAIRNSE